MGVGPVGWQELTFIFLLALLLFGPKKLPELGRMLGKAMTEFRRAQSELKATFEREMQNLERETESLKEISSSSSYQYDNYSYNYDYSSGDASNYGGSHTSVEGASQDSTVNHTTTTSASATEGAGFIAAAPPEGAIAHGSELAANGLGAPEGGPAAEVSVTAEPKA
jgi:TatA/E family protein of Tat protein translocase